MAECQLMEVRRFLLNLDLMQVEYLFLISDRCMKSFAEQKKVNWIFLILSKYDSENKLLSTNATDIERAACCKRSVVIILKLNAYNAFSAKK